MRAAAVRKRNLDFETSELYEKHLVSVSSYGSVRNVVVEIDSTTSSTFSKKLRLTRRILR